MNRPIIFKYTKVPSVVVNYQNCRSRHRSPCQRSRWLKVAPAQDMVTDEFEEKFFIQNLGGKHSYDIWQVVKHFRNKNNGSSSPHWADYRPGSSGLNSNSDATHWLQVASFLLCGIGSGDRAHKVGETNSRSLYHAWQLKLLKMIKSMSGSKTDFPFFNRSQIWSTSLYSQNIPFYRSPGTCMSIQINPRGLSFEV